LTSCIEKVEKLFSQTKPDEQENFDFQRALFDAEHEKHKFPDLLGEPEKRKKKEREQDYEYALNFRRDYRKSVLRIAKHWNVRLLTEEELPNHRKNVIRCEENAMAFISMKKRCFFRSLDMSKADMRERIEAIRKTLMTLDNCHKETQSFIEEFGPSILLGPNELNDILMPSEDDSQSETGKADANNKVNW